LGFSSVDFFVDFAISQRYKLNGHIIRIYRRLSYLTRLAN
jgi:hypothetical protein